MLALGSLDKNYKFGVMVLFMHNLKLVGILLCEQDIIPVMPLLIMAIVGVRINDALAGQIVDSSCKKWT